MGFKVGGDTDGSLWLGKQCGFGANTELAVHAQAHTTSHSDAIPDGYLRKALGGSKRERCDEGCRNRS